MEQIEQKLVNIYPTRPIAAITPTIRNPIINQKMNVGDIRLCLLQRAKVEEILKDGTTVQLDLNTLYLDNEKRIKELKKKENEKKRASEIDKIKLQEANTKIDELNKTISEKNNELNICKQKEDSLNDSLDKANKQISDLSKQLAGKNKSK